MQNHAVVRYKAFQESNITQWEYEKIELSATEVCLLYRLSKGKMFFGDWRYGPRKADLSPALFGPSPDSKIFVPFNGYFDRFDGKLEWNKKKVGYL
mgnify:CR=1 FL=1